MNLRCVLAVLVILTGFSNASLAADLEKIPRKLVKEPAYRTSPKYCLLVFGPEGKTRIWLVVDGNILYVDRNGNGDLTEKDERVEGQPIYYRRPGEAPRPVGITFTVEMAAKWQGKDARLMVVRSDEIDDDDVVNVFSGNECLANTAPGANGVLKFSDRPQDASIIHFDGPLKMALRVDHALSRKKEPQTFQMMIGTPGLGKGSFAALNVEVVPKDVNPVADFEFPNKVPGGNRIRVKFVLSQRC